MGPGRRSTDTSARVRAGPRACVRPGLDAHLAGGLDPWARRLDLGVLGVAVVLREAEVDHRIAQRAGHRRLLGMCSVSSARPPGHGTGHAGRYRAPGREPRTALPTRRCVAPAATACLEVAAHPGRELDRPRVVRPQALRGRASSLERRRRVRAPAAPPPSARAGAARGAAATASATPEHVLAPRAPAAGVPGQAEVGGEVDLDEAAEPAARRAGGVAERPRRGGPVDGVHRRRRSGPPSAPCWSAACPTKCQRRSGTAAAPRPSRRPPGRGSPPRRARPARPAARTSSTREELGDDDEGQPGGVARPAARRRRRAIALLRTGRRAPAAIRSARGGAHREHHDDAGDRPVRPSRR